METKIKDQQMQEHTCYYYQPNIKMYMRNPKRKTNRQKCCLCRKMYKTQINKYWTNKGSTQ